MKKNLILGLISSTFALALLSGCAAPTAAFKTMQTQQEVPSTIVCTNDSKNAKQFEWDFGDGKKSTDKNATHEYKEAGTYTVTLKAKGIKKETVATQTVTILAPKDAEMYNYYSGKGNTYVTLTTSFGAIKILLFDKTPQHRDNFVKLVKEGYYDDLLFHRVINNFMVQGGDPDSRNAPSEKNLGVGGPAYRIPAEFVNDFIHVKGALAAARQGGPVNPEKQSSGSQFYIVHGQKLDENMLSGLEKRSGVTYTADQRTLYLKYGGTPFLDHDYTVFGQVVEGLDIIDKIAAVRTRQGDRPVEDVKMKITVE